MPLLPRRASEGCNALNVCVPQICAEILMPNVEVCGDGASGKRVGHEKQSPCEWEEGSYEGTLANNPPLSGHERVQGVSNLQPGRPLSPDTGSMGT